MHKLFLFFTLIVSTQVFSQTAAVWVEKDNFHTVMAETFHPMEEGNYKPIRERSTELYEKAVIWQKSTVPAGFSQKKLAKKLKKLVEESKKLDDKIKASCTDAVIKEDLTKLHDIFHTIVGLCHSE